MCIECVLSLEPALDPSEAQALRLVLAITLDRDTAAACMGVADDEATSLWPSSLYRVLSVAALASPAVWERCERCVDHALGPCAVRFENRSPAELVQLFAQGRDACSGLELAALLWAVVRRRCPAAAAISGRLGLEIETVAAGRLATDGLPNPATAIPVTVEDENFARGWVRRGSAAT